ncbi:MAG: hypothetical protein H0T73_08820 [Ardenticatenales bacterium]|nr:hypothetical protein [Ardenticatenales bacterium]
MSAKFLGLPFAAWGLLCLLLAALWLVVGPQERLMGATGLRFVVLRYFHALTWLLLAIAAFLAGFDLLGGTSSARMVALLSLAVYITFLITLLTKPSL